MTTLNNAAATDWFNQRGWRLWLWPEYAEARKHGHVSHSIRLDEYLSLEANLWRLRQHILEAYPELPEAW